MFRIFCVALSAFALLAAVAMAKDHTVVVSSVSLDKTTVDAGGSLTTTYKVKNNLSKKANPRTVRFFLTLSEDAKRGFNGVGVGSAKTPKIGAKSTKTLTRPLTVPAGTAAGSYLVLACISGECQATDLRVTVVAPASPAPQPDVTITPASYDFGGWYSQSPDKEFVVTNHSASRTVGPIGFSFNYTVGGNAAEGFIELDSTTCNMLAPGASCTADLYFSAGTPGAPEETSATVGVVSGLGNPPEAATHVTGHWDCNGAGLRARPTPRC